MKVVLQDGIKDCGICSLLSIIRYYGGDVSKEYLREITNTTKEGVSFYQLIEASKKLGIDAVGMNGDITKIDENNLPCIAHIIVNKNYKHFVVIYNIDNKKRLVTLMDPAKGRKCISFSEFNLLSSGNFIFFKKMKDLPILRKKNIVFKYVNKFLKNYKYGLYTLVFLITNYFIINIIISFYFKYLLTFSINYSITDNVYYISFIIMILYILVNVINLIKNIMTNQMFLIFDSILTTSTFKQILLLPYLFYKNRTSGEVLARIKDLNVVKSYLINLFLSIFDLLSIIVFSILIFSINKYFSLLIVIISIVLIIIMFIFNKYKSKIIKIIKNSEDMVNSHLIEAVTSVETIKGSHLEKRYIDNFLLKYNYLLDRQFIYIKVVEIIEFIKNNIHSFLIVSLYSIGSIYIIKGDMNISSILILQIFLQYYYDSLQKIIILINNYSEYKIVKERVEELFLIEEESFVGNYFYLSYGLVGDISINNLNYNISSKKLFLNLCLEIKRGEHLLISGDSGCGKSTLMKMIIRYIEVPYNVIKIDNIDINHYHLENIRKNISYISSMEYLFNDTIRNNIILNNNIVEEEFLKICKVCMVDEICNSYDDMVEENGFNYSNGERQRIVLARSLVRNSNIYIFDEAFGQIDITREKKILTNIFNYLEGKTIIVISHRFNNKKLFDRVLKISEGKISDT